MNLTFVDREKEVAFLEDIYHQKGTKVIILYGRRRVGKTEIIKTFIKNKDSLYFLADKRGTELNAQRFAREAAQHFKDISPAVHNFDDVFTYIVKRRKSLVIALDEFSYLVERDETIPSVFQLIVDEILKGDFLLILCGSSISMMEKALSYKSPLYGRRTGQWLVEPFSFKDVLPFFPNYSFSQVIKAFSVVGNIPAYLVKFDDSIPVFKNIQEKILRKGTFLYEEVEFLLKGELRDPSRYSSILEAVGGGATRLTEIAHKSHIPAKDLSKYVNILQSLHLIEKIKPVTEKKGKKTLYKISDQFFHFWFRFVQPYMSYLESGNTDYIMEIIKSNFNAFVGSSFERICKEALKELNNQKKLPFSFSRLGTWWGYYRDRTERKEVEIDCVALNEKTKNILFAECKWRDNVDVEEILNKLKEKSAYVNWFNASRKEWFAIFGKSFLKRSRDCLCFDLEDLEKLFK